MKMMGLRNWLHWTAWFFKYLVFLLITVILMTILFFIRTNGGSTIQHSDPFIIFIFLLLYSISTIAFCFMVSTFFSKGKSIIIQSFIITVSKPVSFFVEQMFVLNSKESENNEVYKGGFCMILQLIPEQQQVASCIWVHMCLISSCRMIMRDSHSLPNLCLLY